MKISKIFPGICLTVLIRCRPDSRGPGRLGEQPLAAG